MSTFSKESLLALEQRFAPNDALAVLHWALETFGAKAPLACSFGIEDTVLVHLAAQLAEEHQLPLRIFTLDTGRLPYESHEMLERLRERYRLSLEVFTPRSELLEPFLLRNGPSSFYRSVEDRKACCHVRKVEPLGRALQGASAWITGLRRAQSITRAELDRFELDEAHGGLLKLNPLAHFDDAQILATAREQGALIHPLHARGYPSIGCAPCTRATQPGEHPRAGRWWWESPEHKECGLHTSHAS